MRHLDLFSGIGGFALAASWAGYTTIQFVEIDPFCQRVLARHWPGVPIHDDITTFDATGLNGTVDLLTGGFPCQPFSVAGQRRGNDDDRALWPAMRRVIDEARPRWVVAENVPGFIGMALDDLFVDLEALGYETGALVVPAAGVGAPHRRDRLWIIGHLAHAAAPRPPQGRCETGGALWHEARGPEPERLGGGERDWDVPDPASGGLRRGSASGEAGQPAQPRQDVSDADRQRPQRRDERIGSAGEWLTWTGRESNPGIWSVEPDVGRVAHGVPGRVDRLKSLGNAIVPAVAYEIIRHLEIA